MKDKIEIGDTVMVRGFGSMYASYDEMASALGSNRYVRNNKPSLMEFEVLNIGNHPFDCCSIYLLGNVCGEFLFNNRRGEIKVINKAKPTRTEYVNIKCSIFDLKDLKAEFEAGELYMPDGNYGFCSIPSCDEEVFAMKFNDKCVYRKVEREVTWQGELMAAIRGGSPIGESSVRVGDADLTDDQFIEMCHKVYHLTK